MNFSVATGTKRYQILGTVVSEAAPWTRDETLDGSASP
jgi:hypothetical protein